MGIGALAGSAGTVYTQRKVKVQIEKISEQLSEKTSPAYVAEVAKQTAVQGAKRAGGSLVGGAKSITAKTIDVSRSRSRSSASQPVDLRHRPSTPASRPTKAIR